MRFLFSIAILAILCIGCEKKDPTPNNSTLNTFTSNGTNWTIKGSTIVPNYGVTFVADSMQNYPVTGFFLGSSTSSGYTSQILISAPPILKSGIYPLTYAKNYNIIDSISLATYFAPPDTNSFHFPNVETFQTLVNKGGFASVTVNGSNITIEVSNIKLFYQQQHLFNSPILDSIYLTGTFIKKS
jgi:hypothetical protein